MAGGTGFLGGAVVGELASRGGDVVVLSRNPARARRRLEPLGVGARRGDVTRPASLAGAFDDIDTVVQSVQFPGFPVEAPERGRTFLEVDARGTETLVAAARAGGVRKFVYLSGVGADPVSARVWYRAKGLAESSVRASGLTWAVVRPSWVYGPGDVSLNRFLKLIRLVPLAFPQLGPGTQRITPVYVDDLARLVADVVQGTAADGAVIEAGGPETMTLDEIVRTAMRVVGRVKPIVHVPIGLVKLVAGVLERLPGQIFSRDAVDFVTQDGVADPSELARRFPEFAPLRLETALSSYLS